MKLQKITKQNLKKGVTLMHKNGHLYKVIEYFRQTQNVKLVRDGGGFVIMLKLTTIDKDFTHIVKKYTPRITKEEVCIDDDKYYPCKTDKYKLWNGWVMPYFKRKVAIEILKDFKLKIKLITRKEIHYYDDDWKCVEVVMKGKYGFGLGAGSWIWSLKED